MMIIQTTERYCPICGREVRDLNIKRFGEYLCSEEHAEEYVKEVRAQRAGVTRFRSEPEEQITYRSCHRVGCC
ncbi:MAG TPA: hypothetical protein VNM22_15940 [Candidatus Limnocylindrales bacterium]|nr:hypothetical protein [Candidatus Limnocylindrales bacterium]